MIITTDAINKSVYFYIVGNASHALPGDPITGLLFSDIETGGSASYVRQGEARADLTLVTLASASATHSDGGFIEVDATNMPGVYRCDFPDAAWATGVDQVICQLVAATANNAAIAPILIDLSEVIVQAVWNESTSGYSTNRTMGKIMKGVSEGLVADEGAVADASATATEFISNLGQTADGFFNEAVLVFTGGALQGQANIITAYTGATRTFTFDEAFTSAPADTDSFTILAGHTHSISSITAAIAAHDMGNGRTIEEALAFLRNKWTIVGGTLTVYDTDDVTVLWTSAMVQTAGDPVSSSDPT